MPEPTSPSRQLFAVELAPSAFSAVLRERERLVNAGALSQIDAVTGWTVWTIAGEWVGLTDSAGSVRYALVTLTDEQAALVRGEPVENWCEHLWHMARVTRFDSYPLALSTSTAPLLLPLGSLIGPKGGSLPVGTRVALRPTYLERGLPQAEQRRLAGRVGTVSGYRLGARHPTVTFPAAGRRKEYRMFEVPHMLLLALGTSPQDLAQPFVPTVALA